ncbi:NAD(P)-dependent oxidoreductase [Mycetocola tolaasinivorans]|uniref:NAD(P)-dependent oxidoreductase n=1 Tax=Mycetocola tolaasinivorans TaxID=76635 RepID=A0A3L7A5V2_9MICO|nr:NAD(P)-dependent oxidoreductase [Mycetocola tolaasinivorans]RLP74722.1 NAD(P)-dependent oxidoreductase [Mycetocola tolaasinivorans]
MSAATRVAVLGLGAMGLPMAQRLAERGHEVLGFDIAEPRLELARASGIQTFGSARAASAEADAVILAVRDVPQLTEVLFGAGGIAEVLRPGSVVILTSTVGIEPVREVAAQLARLDIELLDAPISGGAARAREGDLLLIVGGSDAAREASTSILAALASTVSVVGPNPGDGQAQKTVNQLLCGVHIAAAAEALTLARSLGLDPAESLRSLEAGAAASFMLSNRGPRILEALEGAEPEVLSRVDIFVKDLGIVTRAAEELGLATPVALAAHGQYVAGVAAGLESHDDSTLVRILPR